MSDSGIKIKTNPDKEIVNLIREGLKKNDGYCPCRLTKSEDTRCMCKEFMDAKEGMCHCGLYIKEII